jgi:hypothetical protein
MNVARLCHMKSATLRRAAACALLAIACGCGTTEQSRESAAVREFHDNLGDGRADLIYTGSSEFLRAQFSKEQFERSLFKTRIMGHLEASERAHYTRTKADGGADLVMAFYNSRYAKGSCLETFTWRMEGDSLKLAAYSCAPNMKVTCGAGASCETSPVPPPGFAG